MQTFLFLIFSIRLTGMKMSESPTVAEKTMTGKTMAGKTMAGKTTTGKTMTRKTMMGKTMMGKRMMGKNEKKRKRRLLKKKKQTGSNGMKVATVTITDVPWEWTVLIYFLYQVINIVT